VSYHFYIILEIDEIGKPLRYKHREWFFPFIPTKDMRLYLEDQEFHVCWVTYDMELDKFSMCVRYVHNQYYGVPFKDTNGGRYKSRVSGINNIGKIFNFLYNDSSIYLERKHSKFLEIMSAKTRMD